MKVRSFVALRELPERILNQSLQANPERLMLLPKLQ
jgi:hypothetical protein